MSVEFVIAPGTAQETILTESDIQDYTPVKTHTGKASLRASLATNKTLLDFARIDALLNINIDGATEWTGFLRKVNNTQETGRTRIKGEGIANRLEKTRPDYSNLSGERVTYSQIALEDAIRDYWGRTEFSNYSVTDEPTEIVEQDVILQLGDDNTSWSGKFSFDNTQPVLIEDDNLKLGQVGYFAEGESVSGAGGNVSDSIASDGTVKTFFEDFHSATYSFSLDYTIPEENVAVGIRLRNPSDPDDDGTFEGPNLDLTIAGDNQGTFSGDKPNDNYSWTQETGYSGNDISGSVDVTIDTSAAAPSGASTYIDAVFLYDDRFSYTFDNSVDSNGYLSGPELYPHTLTVTTNGEQTDLNITALEIISTWTDTSGNQALGVSNDDGQTFLTESNTQTIDKTFSSGGRTAKAQFTLDGYGTRTTASPTEDYLGQEIDSYELRADLDNLTVIDELELTNNHFENLQTLHEYGNYLWTIEHDSSDIANLVVNSYQEGSETRPAPSAYADPISKDSTIDVRNYFNELFFYGARNDNDNYPHVEVSDQDEINDVGKTVSATLHDPNVTTFAGARFRANALLAELTDENNRKGQITIPVQASITHPGYAREIDFGDGPQEKTIEEVELTESQERVAQTHQFTPPDNVASKIEQLKRNARDVRDKV